MTATWLSKQKLNILLFSLFVFFLPTQFGYHFWPDWSLVAGLRVDYFAPTVMVSDILAIALVTNYFLSLRKEDLRHARIKISKYWMAAFGVGVFVLLNIALSINLPESIYKWLKIFEFSLVGFWVFRNKKLVKQYLPRVLLVGLVYSLLLGAMQIILGRTVGGVFYFLGERSFTASTPGVALVNLFGKNYLRAYASFAHPNVLAGFSLVGLFTILEFEKNNKLKWLGGIVAILNIILSFSLGAVIGFGITMLIYFLKLYKPLSHVYRQIVLCFLLVSIVLMPVSNAMITSEVKVGESTQKRLELAAIAGEAFASSPVLGIGQGGFISFIPRSSVQNSMWFLQPVHNIFLLVLSENGMIGIGLFVFILFGLKIRKYPVGLTMILPVLTTGLFDHYWLTLNPTAFLFAMVVGILF